MALDPKTWTTKTQEAVAAAVDLAKGASNPEITPDHVLVAICAQEGTIVPAVLSQLGKAPQMVRNQAEEALAKLPRAHGGAEPRMNRDLSAVFERAMATKKDLRDDYLSVEHLLLALHPKLGVSNEEMLAARSSQVLRILEI